MHIGISWNESENRFYLTVGNNEMKSVRNIGEIEPYCLKVLKDLPYEKIEPSLAVPLWEKPDIEKIIKNIDEEWKKQEAK